MPFLLLRIPDAFKDNAVDAMEESIASPYEALYLSKSSSITDSLIYYFALDIDSRRI